MPLTTLERQQAIAQLRAVPAKIRSLVTGLGAHDLTTSFITGEWTVAQNVHHLIDSQMHGYVRCKRIATEDHPTLIPFDQDVWAEMPDSTAPDVLASVAILEGLHERWALFLEGLEASAWTRTGYHPERAATLTIDDIVVYFAQHGELHITQIEETLAART